MKRFNPFDFEEIDHEKEHQSPQGRLMLKLSKEGALYVTVQGVEALVGSGTEFDVRIDAPFTFKVEAAKSVRVFLYSPTPINYRAEGEVFTNADRQPMESGTLQEVRKALRAHTLQQRGLLEEIKRESAELRRASKPLKKRDEEPVQSGEPDPVHPDPEGEAFAE